MESFDACVYLEVETAAQAEQLMQRKYTRSGHLGKPSYAERGVSELEYRRYWTDCAFGRFLEYGSAPPADAKRLCTTDPPERLAEQAAGFLAAAAAGGDPAVWAAGHDAR